MNKRTFHSPARKVSFAIGSVIAATLFAPTNAAQVLVTDREAMTSSHADAATSYAKQGLQYAKQLDQYATQVNQYENEMQQLAQQIQMVQNILMTAQSLGSNIQLFDGQLLQPITDTYSVIQTACPGAPSAGALNNLLNLLADALSPNQPITTRQQVLCAQIVMYEIDEYNKTADALNKLGTTNNSTLDKLNNLITEVHTLGTSSNATAQAANISATVQTALATWRTEMQADDEIIQELKQQQAILATIAMKGSNTILGTVVQASALKAAFNANP